MEFRGDRPVSDRFDLPSTEFNRICETRDWSIVPEKYQPKKNCSKCYGRGFMGRELKTGDYFACPCTGLHYERGKR